MSRYIDADAMLEYLDLMYDKQDDWIEPYNTGVLGTIYYIKHKAPSIDIVRCRECKLGGTEDCPMDEIDDEYFCNFGERESREIDRR